MNNNHRAFFATPEGRPFELVLRRPVHQYGYALLSTIGQPAIGAVAWELDPMLARIPKGRVGFVKQACGSLVGDIMQTNGASRATTRSGRARSARVKASRVLSMGAVWVMPTAAIARLAAPLR